MDASSSRWTTVSDSPHDDEREALAFLRRRLCDLDPYRVWADFAFTTPSGALHEVDALATTDNGVRLIEITSYPGQICGDGATSMRSSSSPTLTCVPRARRLPATRSLEAIRRMTRWSSRPS